MIGQYRGKHSSWMVAMAIVAGALTVMALMTFRCAPGPEAPHVARTFCNPINISYRFQPDEPSRREAADPVVVLYHDDYYLFASKSGGYWYSPDLAEWTFVPITTDVLPIEDYAPAVAVIDDALYYVASSGSRSPVYKSTDPKAGVWELAHPSFAVWDPDFFVDEASGKNYLYWGCSPTNPIYGVEMDLSNPGDLRAGETLPLFDNNSGDHGWERTGDNNEIGNGPWMEGAWMTEHNGIYYLQYAAPDTEFKTYADGIYTATSPLGPFEYAPYSPFSHKPTGFIAGAGHGATFQDRYGNYWRVVTMVIAVKHDFERRLGIIPAGFDDDGVMYANTLFGDYPIYLPDGPRDQLTETRPDWMLLTSGATTTASSSLEGYPPELGADEDVKTYWAAETNSDDEWFMIDFGEECTVNAVQINFGEHETDLYGREGDIAHRYLPQRSTDGIFWFTIEVKTESTDDTPHDYIELAKPEKARYIRVRNVAAPGDGPFAIRDLRVFGAAPGNAPGLVPSYTVVRDPADGRNMHVRWEPANDADGYIIRYGIDPDKLYNNYQVTGASEYDIRSLNRGVTYYVTIDTFNRSGYTPGHGVHAAPPND